MYAPPSVPAARAGRETALIKPSANADFANLFIVLTHSFMSCSIKYFCYRPLTVGEHYSAVLYVLLYEFVSQIVT